MLELCAQLMVAHLGAALAQIWTPHPQEDRLQRLASAGDLASATAADGSAPAMRFKLDDVVRARGTVATNALVDDPRVDREWAVANGIVSFVGYPLIVGDRVVGVIAMFGRAPLSEATVQAISYIANAVASAIERDRSETAQARLADELRASDERMRFALEAASMGVWEFDVQHSPRHLDRDAGARPRPPCRALRPAPPRTSSRRRMPTIATLCGRRSSARSSSGRISPSCSAPWRRAARRAGSNGAAA